MKQHLPTIDFRKSFGSIPGRAKRNNVRTCNWPPGNSSDTNDLANDVTQDSVATT